MQNGGVVMANFAPDYVNEAIWKCQPIRMPKKPGSPGCIPADQADIDAAVDACGKPIPSRRDGLPGGETMSNMLPRSRARSCRSAATSMVPERADRPHGRAGLSQLFAEPSAAAGPTRTRRLPEAIPCALRQAEAVSKSMAGEPPAADQLSPDYQ
jgi:hypothetical protein